MIKLISSLALGSQTEQTFLWWSEAKEIENEVSIENLFEKTGILLEKLTFMPIERDVKKELIYESLYALSKEIALRFMKKPIFADDDFLEKLKLSLGSVGIDYRNIDMTYRLGFS